MMRLFSLEPLRRQTEDVRTRRRDIQHTQDCFVKVRILMLPRILRGRGAHMPIKKRCRTSEESATNCLATNGPSHALRYENRLNEVTVHTYRSREKRDCCAGLT